MKSIKEYLVNESKFDSTEITNLLTIAALPKSFKVNIDIDYTGNELKNSDFVIKHSVGPIVECMVSNCLEQWYDGKNSDWKFTHILNNKEKTEDSTINTACDGYFKNKKTNETVNIEIKAYTTSSNLKPTASQWKADYMFLVKYKLVGTTVNILDVALGEPNGNASNNVKITSEIIKKAHR